MSGWSALTLNFDNEQYEEEVDAVLRQEYTGRDPYTAEGYANTTVQVGRHADHRSVAAEFAEEFPRARSIVVVSANDTTDSGHGTLFRVTLSNDGSNDRRFNEHPVKEIDRKEGHNGAQARDVVGYFDDMHGVRCYNSWEA